MMNAWMKKAGATVGMTLMVSMGASTALAGDGDGLLPLPIAPTTLVEIGEATFNDAEVFTPLAELTTSEVNPDTLSLAERATRMRPVAATREGKLLEGDIDPAHLAVLQKALARAGAAHDLGALPRRSVMEGGVETDAEAGESVIGTDSRTQITYTTSYPFRTVGRVAVGCTGTLIGPRHVLTAGHCVYNTNSNSWYSSLDFSPGQNGSYRPYGEINWDMAISVSGWVDSEDRNYDYAMIVLDEDIGSRVGWMSYGYDDGLPYYTVNINGYPGDKPYGTMWHSYCSITDLTSKRIYYPCDTYGGMSGSGVYVYWSSSSTRIIYGIHAYGVDSTGYNGATRIDSSAFSNLYSWKRSY